MTQIATIVKQLPDERAEIVVARQSACAHDCSECSGCGGTPQPIYTQAINLIGAQPGDKVVVESSTGQVLGAAYLVYFLPFLLFFLGYFLTAGRVPVGLDYAIGAVFFALSFLLIRQVDKKLKEKGGVEFRVVRKL